MSENEEWNRNTSGEVNNEQSTREAVDILDGRLYYEVIIDSRKRCDIGSM